MNQETIREDYQTQRSEVRKQDSYLTLKRTLHNQSIQSIIGKPQTENNLSMKKQLDSYLANSPSRQRRRIIKLNPVYQAKYVSKPKAKKNLNISLNYSNDKISRFDNSFLPKISVKKNKPLKRNTLIPTSKERSLNNVKKRGSCLTTIRDARFLMGAYPTDI